LVLRLRMSSWLTWNPPESLSSVVGTVAFISNLQVDHGREGHEFTRAESRVKAFGL
jgi:hypothetical protein